MQSSGSDGCFIIADSRIVDENPTNLWAPPKSTSPTFTMTSPFDSNDSFSVLNNQYQIKMSANESENSRMWSPQDDKIFSGSTDSDTSGSYRDVRQPRVTNSNLPLAPAPQCAVPVSRHSESPTNFDRKWAPQSPESSRFFTGGHRDPRDLPGPFVSLENLDKRASDKSPCAVAVTHGSPLDLSFPVKDSRADCYDTAGSANIGLGIAQRRGSHGENSSTAFSPMSSPGRGFAPEGLLTSSSASAKGIFNLLQQERQRSNSQAEMTDHHQNYAPAPFPSLSSVTTPMSPFRGIPEVKEQPAYGYNHGLTHESEAAWMPERNEFLKGKVPSEETSPFQSLQKSHGQYDQGHSALQTQEFSNRLSQGPVPHGQNDMFSMESLQHSLRATNIPTTYSAHQQQQQHIQQQQQLPPRSPQMQPQMLHPGPSYFSPTRGQANGSPITTNAFSHPNALGEYYAHAAQSQTHVQTAYNSMPGSPYMGNSRGASPVHSEYSYGCGSGAYLHNAQSHPQHSPSERPPQRLSQPQQHQESHMQFSSIEQHNQQPYDGCIYQVQFKRSHRCLILSSSAPQGIKPGDFVIVEADRGEDLGVVVSMAPRDSPLAATIFAACSSSMRGPDSEFLKKILRIASMQERMDLPSKAQEEIDLLEVCRERSREMYSLPMSLVDAEYQFDRHKLILYYSASRRIDFREFVRDLFAIYKTRIWMEQATAHHSFRPSETAARALATGVLHQSHSPLTLPPSVSGSNCASPLNGTHTATGIKFQGPASFVGDLQQRNYSNGIYPLQNVGVQGHQLPMAMTLEESLTDLKYTAPLLHLMPSHQTTSPPVLQSHHEFHYGLQNQGAHASLQNHNFPPQGLQQPYGQHNLQTDELQQRFQKERYQMEQ